MIGYLAKLWIPNYKQYDDATVRHQYGNLTSLVGIVSNLILFVLKFVSGVITNSVSIQADAINNLSDAGSSIIALVSFRLSNLPADKKHPFGHARFECIASMIVACLIFLLGFDLLKSSVLKIIHPEEVDFSIVSLGILAVAILTKLWMYTYNKKYGKLLDSSIMEATAADSISDALSTGAVFVSMILSSIFHFNFDGYVGVLVASIILYTGYGIVVQALDEILGKAPDPELVSKIQTKIMSYPGVLGMHDLMIHDYGAHNTFASAHVEVDCKVDINQSHDVIDNIERDIKEAMDIELVIHMDPINIDDELTNTLRAFTKKVMNDIHPELSIHDFRIVVGTSHTNVIFDVVVPFSYKKSNSELLEEIKQRFASQGHTYYLVVTFDREYTSQSQEKNV